MTPLEKALKENEDLRKLVSSGGADMKGDGYYEYRTQRIEGAKNDRWYWWKEDTGAWVGPVDDWNQCHYHKYVEPIPHKRVVVTAGGNMGLYTRAYSDLFENVYVFEPDTDNFHALVRNNYADNVFFFKAGLGAQPGWCNVAKSSSLTNLGMHRCERTAHGPVPMMTIDQLNLNQCDLIQLDIEGGEPDALAGAKATVDRFAPVIVTEGNHKKVRNLIEQWGYEFSDASKADYIYRKKV